MTIAVDLGCKATNQTNKSNKITLPTLKKVLVLANSVEPDEMVFTVCKRMHLRVTSKNKVNRTPVQG